MDRWSLMVNRRIQKETAVAWIRLESVKNTTMNMMLADSLDKNRTAYLYNGSLCRKHHTSTLLALS
jgi:hypothetical protein